MKNQITYDKMFDVLNVRNIIIFEDDFPVNTGKKEICYGLARMSMINRNRMLLEISEINPVGKGQLEEFVKEFDKIFDAIEDWDNQIPYNDIEIAFSIVQEIGKYTELLSNVLEQYRMIDMESWTHKNES